MRHRALARFTSFCLCLIASFAVLAAEKAAPRTSDTPNAQGPQPNALGAQDVPEASLTIDQVIALLEAKVGEKVILRQIEATGTRLTMTVDALLSLKAAGASDALLEALQGETPHTAVPEAKAPAPKTPALEKVEGEYPFRVFLMEDKSGGRVVHITNLDENGKRIGGELPADNRATPNVLANGSQAPPPADRYEASTGETGYSEGGGGQQPVIVNVYNQAPASPSDGTALIGGSEPIGGDAFINTGIYPGYFNYGYGYSPTVYPHGAVVGPRYGYGGVIYSPPGSYSHYVRYHRPYGAHTFKQATPWSPAYRWGAPASTRNQVYFGRR